MKLVEVVVFIIYFVLFATFTYFIIPHENNVEITKNESLPILTNNLSTICVSEYSSTVRDVPYSLRLKIFERDNVSYPQPEGSTELDHIIPLCLGGDNSANNLFVQFENPKPGYKEKDHLEVYLCRKVCSGEIDINYTQNRIYQNWTNYYEELFGPIV